MVVRCPGADRNRPTGLEGTGSCCLVGAETQVGKTSVLETDNGGGTTH